MNATMASGPGDLGWTDVSACTLPTAARPLRTEFDDLFTIHLRSVERSGVPHARLAAGAMSRLRDRHLVGGAAAACAVCCAAPIIGFLGVAGFAATAVTLAFAGVVFALVVAAAAIATVVVRRRHARSTSCTVAPAAAAAVPVELARPGPATLPDGH